MQADFTNQTVRLICETIAQLESESNPVLRQQLSAVLQQTIVNLCSELQNENLEAMPSNPPYQLRISAFRPAADFHQIDRYRISNQGIACAYEITPHEGRSTLGIAIPSADGDAVLVAIAMVKETGMTKEEIIAARGLHQLAEVQIRERVTAMYRSRDEG
jgi:hypothetical protein